MDNRLQANASESSTVLDGGQSRTRRHSTKMRAAVCCSLARFTPSLLFFPVVFSWWLVVQSLHRPMLEVLGLVDLHYVVGSLLFVVAVMGVLAGHLRHHLLLQVR